jgi:hypothetical protein
MIGQQTQSYEKNSTVDKSRYVNINNRYGKYWDHNIGYHWEYEKRYETIFFVLDFLLFFFIINLFFNSLFHIYICK